MGISAITKCDFRLYSVSDSIRHTSHPLLPLLPHFPLNQRPRFRSLHEILANSKKIFAESLILFAIIRNVFANGLFTDFYICEIHRIHTIAVLYLQTSQLTSYQQKPSSSTRPPKYIITSPLEHRGFHKNSTQKKTAHSLSCLKSNSTSSLHNAIPQTD